MNVWKIGMIFVLGVSMVLTGCKSTRQTVGHSGELSDREQVEKVIAQTPRTDCITAKMRFSLQLGEKDFSVGGNFRMKKDDVIQLSLVGLGIIEGGRVEFTRDSVLLVDRIHHQYVSVAYKDVNFLNEAQVDFYTLQALFWNELILPGVQHVTSAEIADFKATRDGENLVLVNRGNRKLAYRFITSLVSNLLERTEISTQSDYCLNWKYTDFVELAGTKYPSQMQIELLGFRTLALVTLSLNRFSTSSGWSTRTQVSKRYTRVEPEKLIELLMKM